MSLALILSLAALTAPLPQSAPGCGDRTLSRAQLEKIQSAYRGRVLLQGRAKADAWLRTQCGETTEAVAEDAARKKAPQRPTPRAAARDGKGCRMVSRPVAGLGGAPMTMAMVPDCSAGPDE